MRRRYVRSEPVSFSEPCGNGSSASFATSATMRDTVSRGIRRRSFFVDARHRRLKEAIALELGNELLVRNGGLFSALCYDGQVFQVFQQFFVVGDWKNDGRAFAAIIRDVLNRIAHWRKDYLNHQQSATPTRKRKSAMARPPSSTGWQRVLPDHFIRSKVFWRSSRSLALPVFSRLLSIHFFSSAFLVGRSD
jgi:hypothetical protein